MKKILKKLSCALLAAAMVCAMTPLAASAAINYSKTRIVYMPTSGKDLGYDEISISNIPAKQNITNGNKKITLTYRMICRITAMYSDISKI